MKAKYLKYSRLTVRQPDRRAGIAIGEYILDLSCLEEEGLFRDTYKHE
jgi:hypothetical protein